MREIDLAKEKQKIVAFISRFLDQNGFSKVILGISGGIDSAVVAALAVEASGAENVFGVMMPYKSSNPDSLNDGLALAKALGIPYRVAEITPMVDAWFDNYEQEASPLRRGNYMARIRMTVLYDLSVKENALVLGTGNYSELMSGYTTQYGDNACAFEPIGHLYKTEVRKLAALLNIPESIRLKNPSADLWGGQTDEAELGISYQHLDGILYLLLEKKYDYSQIVAAGYQMKDVVLVDKLFRKSEFKRRMPPMISD